MLIKQDLEQVAELQTIEKWSLSTTILSLSSFCKNSYDHNNIIITNNPISIYHFPMQ